MNAIGIAASPKAAAPAAGANGASAAGAAGKQGAAGAFAGTLIHVMEGSSASGQTAAAGIGIPAALFGLLGLLGGQTEESTSSSELMKLIAGLMEQLEGLDNGQELPSDLQNQLAALLVLVQNLLKPFETDVTAMPDMTAGLQPSTATSVLPDEAAKTGQTIVANLQQALKELMDKLSHGEVAKAQTSALTEPVAQTLTALQHFAGQNAKGKPGPSQTMAAAADAHASALPLKPEMQAAGNAQAASQPEIRAQHRPAALQQLAWTSGEAAGTGTETGMPAALQADGLAVDAADAPVSGSPTPVWTLLKDAPSVIPAGTSNLPTQAQVPVHQFAEEMDKFLVRQFMLAQGNGATEARISLHPEHLGQVDIKIVIQNGLLTAQFVTDNGAARELLESQMAQLRSSLQVQGLQVERMEVVQQQPSQTPASFMGNHQGQQGTGHNGGGAKRGNRGGYEDSAGFEAELDRTAFLRDIGYGSALNVTA